MKVGQDGMKKRNPNQNFGRPLWQTIYQYQCFVIKDIYTDRSQTGKRATLPERVVGE